MCVFVIREKSKNQELKGALHLLNVQKTTLQTNSLSLSLKTPERERRREGLAFVQWPKQQPPSPPLPPPLPPPPPLQKTHLPQPHQLHPPRARRHFGQCRAIVHGLSSSSEGRQNGARQWKQKKKKKKWRKRDRCCKYKYTVVGERIREIIRSVGMMFMM